MADGDLEAARARLLESLEGPSADIAPPTAGASATDESESHKDLKRKREDAKDTTIPIHTVIEADDSAQRTGQPMTPQQLSDLERQFAGGRKNENGDMVYFKRSFIEDPWAHFHD